MRAPGSAGFCSFSLFFFASTAKGWVSPAASLRGVRTAPDRFAALLAAAEARAEATDKVNSQQQALINELQRQLEQQAEFTAKEIERVRVENPFQIREAPFTKSARELRESLRAKEEEVKDLTEQLDSLTELYEVRRKTSLSLSLWRGGGGGSD